MAEGQDPNYSDILNDPVDQLRRSGASTPWTNVAANLYNGMKHPNLSTREDLMTSQALPYVALANVAGQMLPPPNTGSDQGMPAGVSMNLVMKQLEENLTRVQQFLLGAP